MSKTRQPANPFYSVLVIVGAVFCITASAYGVMVLKSTRVAVRNQEVATSDSDHDLLRWMDENGMQAMGIELAILGVATVGAIWLDSHRAAREDQHRSGNNSTA